MGRGPSCASDTVSVTWRAAAVAHGKAFRTRFAFPEAAGSAEKPARVIRSVDRSDARWCRDPKSRSARLRPASRHRPAHGLARPHAHAVYRTRTRCFRSDRPALPAPVADLARRCDPFEWLIPVDHRLREPVLLILENRSAGLSLIEVRGLLPKRPCCRGRRLEPRYRVVVRILDPWCSPGLAARLAAGPRSRRWPRRGRRHRADPIPPA